MENQVSIIINGVRYDAVEGVYCSDCSFCDSCDSHQANLCEMVGVFNCGFKISTKSFEP